MTLLEQYGFLDLPVTVIQWAVHRLPDAIREACGMRWS